MSSKTIYLCKDFSSEPYGRFKEHGENNGARFRNQFLIPALRHFDLVVVDLNGASYGSSFLEEAFGGLVRLGYFNASSLMKHLCWKHKLASTRDRVQKYILEADFGIERDKAHFGELDYPIPA